MRTAYLTLLAAFMFSSLNISAQQYKIDFLGDSIRILYTGYDNTIIVPQGASLTVVSPSNSSVLAKINDVTFSAKPMASLAGKEIKFRVQHKGKSVTRIFKVKNLPIPSVYIGGINIETANTATKAGFLLSAPNGVRISYPSDVMIKVMFKIIHYHIKIKIAGIAILDETVEGAKFSDKVMKLFKDKSQYTVEISDILGEGPSGQIRTTTPLPLQVK